MKKHTITVPIRPKAKARPRVGKYGNVYTTKADKEYEQAIGAAWIGSEGPFFTTPVEMNVIFFNDKITITVSSLEESSSIRKDLDNLLKAVMDGLNGVAFQDDNQVIKLIGIKK